MLCHQGDEVHQVALTEDLQRGRVRLRADVMRSEQLTAKLDQGRFLFRHAAERPAVAHDVDECRLQAVLGCAWLMEGPVVLRIVLPRGDENRESHESPALARLERREAGAMAVDVTWPRALRSEPAGIEIGLRRLVLASNQRKAASRIRVDVARRRER